MAFEITNITLQTEDLNGLKDVAVFASFTTKKGDKTKQYSVNLLPPDPKDFTPLKELTDADKEAFIRAKMGEGNTMTEKQFEAELDQ